MAKLKKFLTEIIIKKRITKIISAATAEDAIKKLKATATERLRPLELTEDDFSGGEASEIETIYQNAGNDKETSN